MYLKGGTLRSYNNIRFILFNCEAKMSWHIWRENVRLQNNGNHEHKYVRRGEHILIDNAGETLHRRLACADELLFVFVLFRRISELLKCNNGAKINE